MALQGKIIELSRDTYGFEYIDNDYNKPEQIRQVWPIVALQTRGSMSYCRNEEAIGKPASISDGRVSCYLGNGNYVHGQLPELGATKSIVLEVSPVPRPKCRVETRWYAGRWQRLTRKGWQNA
jgi:hypothetical protein